MGGRFFPGEGQHFHDISGCIYKSPTKTLTLYEDVTNFQTQSKYIKMEFIKRLHFSLQLLGAFTVYTFAKCVYWLIDFLIDWIFIDMQKYTKGTSLKV